MVSNLVTAYPKHTCKLRVLKESVSLQQSAAISFIKSKTNLGVHACLFYLLPTKTQDYTTLGSAL